MIEPKKSPARSFLHVSRRVVSMAGLAIALSACGLMRIKPGDESQALAYLYRSEDGFVRIERIEPGAPDNAHPFAISPDALRQALANLKAKGTVSRGAAPVFTSEELEKIAPHLATALAKAGPKEDVVFAVTGDHGWFGKYSPETVTTGRVFTRDERLNVVFGVVHELYERQPGSSGGLRRFLPGSRARQIEGGWVIVPGSARLADSRPDWVIFDTTTLPVATTLPAPADSRAQEIERKLRVLDRLKATGSITEEEYRDQRRAILQGL